MEIGHIPNTNDQVIAGSADRVRLSSPKVVFAVGVNEGVFPARYQPCLLYTSGRQSFKGQQLLFILFQRFPICQKDLSTADLNQPCLFEFSAHPCHLYP